MLTVQQGMDATSVAFMLCGTYLITKVSFVDFIMRELKSSVVFQNLTPFLRFVCRFYFIDENNWRDHLSGKKRAVTEYEPFAGFAWIFLASLIQLTRIFIVK